jgi:hypothetical protein
VKQPGSVSEAPKKQPESLEGKGREGKGKESLEPASPVRVANPLMDAIMLHGEQTDPLKASPSLWPKVAVALKDIRAASPDVTTDEIEKRAKNYHSHFNNASISATALAKHWGRCEKANTNENTDRSHGRGFEQSGDYSGITNKG